MAPTTSSLHNMFKPLSIQSRQSEFFNSVSDSVHWTILGHSPMSGVYTSKTSFISATLTVLRDKILTEPLRLIVRQVITDDKGGAGWATVEMTAAEGTTCKDGMTYDMVYCWVCRFDEEEKIVEVRAYLDTKLLGDAMSRNP